MFCTSMIAASMLSNVLMTSAVLNTTPPTPAVEAQQPTTVLTDDHLEQPQSTYLIRQPYTRPSASFESRVEGCGLSHPLSLASMDDFKVQRTGDIIGMRWWGTLATTAQVGRPYYIAFYTDADCKPANLAYQECVVPQVRRVTTDCTNSRVFEFRTAIPPFTVVGGRKYWLQISEADLQSARPGLEDFRWSGHQPVVDCPALTTPNYVDYRPLFDPCNQRPSDLSFDLLVRVP